MNIRCDFHVNNGHRRYVVAVLPEETRDHVALRLSALLFFWKDDPKPELSLKHPALAGQEFKPDLIALNEAGEISLWVECGNVSMNKLDKLTRRYPGARLVALKADEASARRLRRDARERIARHELLDIWAWPKEAFKHWAGAVHETLSVFGEADHRSLNLVANDVPIAADLIQVRPDDVV